MKRKIGGVLFASVVLMASCAVAEEATPKVEAGSKEAFEVISSTEVGDYSEVIEIVHKETGCHYLVTEGYNDDGVTTQMKTIHPKSEIEIPYCEDVK